MIELPIELKQSAVGVYKDFFDNTEDGQTLWPFVTGAIIAYPDSWYIPHHFGWGMYMRNLLREHGLLDSMLPEGSNTWDDYYVELIEIALGFKDMEGNRIEEAYDKTHVHPLLISTPTAEFIRNSI
jgi:hypothetical protein